MSKAIKWMTGFPAPDVVLELISCKCTRHCRPSDCTCLLNGLKCTTSCRLANCSNMEDEEDDDQAQQATGDDSVYDSDD